MHTVVPSLSSSSAKPRGATGDAAAAKPAAASGTSDRVRARPPRPGDPTARFVFVLAVLVARLCASGSSLRRARSNAPAPRPDEDSVSALVLECMNGSTKCVHTSWKAPSAVPHLANVHNAASNVSVFASVYAKKICDEGRGAWSEMSVGRIVGNSVWGVALTQVRLVTRIIMTSRTTVTTLGMMSRLTYRSASWMPRSTRLSAMAWSWARPK